MPAEINNLVFRTGIMQPAGTILYAESDTRILHELLWELRLMAYENKSDLDYVINFTLRVLQYFRKKLEGLYFLANTAKIIENVETWLPKCENFEEYIKLMDELILYIGRINMWIDLLIPWYHINENFRSHVNR